MRGFLNDLYVRNSCYCCPARNFTSHSDVTIGDFWGVHKLGLDEMNDEKGLSIMTVNSDKGKRLFEAIASSIFFREITLEQAIMSNPNLRYHSKKNEILNDTFQRHSRTMPLSMAIEHTLYIPFMKRAFIKIKNKGVGVVFRG